jgi:ribosomal protein S18 acetylase RimI-like enzyme
VTDYELIGRIDAFCDAVPRRRARADNHGPLVLFVPTGPGWPYYARPRRGSRTLVTAADIRAVRARQRELIIPESFEWIEQIAPEMIAAAAEAGLEVHTHPLMVLTELAQVPPLPSGVTVRIVAPSDPELDRIWAVPAVAFSHPGTAVGEAGTAERDKRAADHDGGTIAMLRERLRSGQSVLAAASGQDGPLGAGSCQAVDGVAEITGVGVLPASRRQGLGAAVTALLAADALERGVQTVFLSASDKSVARIYASIGFREIGTAVIAEPAALSVQRPVRGERIAPQALTAHDHEWARRARKRRPRACRRLGCRRSWGVTRGWGCPGGRFRGCRAAPGRHPRVAAAFRAARPSRAARHPGPRHAADAVRGRLRPGARRRRCIRCTEDRGCSPRSGPTPWPRCSAMP